MAQNIYDRPGFVEAYSQFRRSRLGLAGAAEWPSMEVLLPAMGEWRVVDLGCGFGWFCRWAREAGADSVLGFDISENMLARARAETDDDAITYRRADLQTLALPEAAFDLACSSLAAPTRAEWIETGHGRKIWPLDGYLREGKRTTDWLAAGVIKFHRTLGTTVNLLIDGGFAIRRVIEWGPSEAAVTDLPSLALELERPMFALISAVR